MRARSRVHGRLLSAFLLAGGIISQGLAAADLGTLSMEQAIALALSQDGNLRIGIGAEGVDQARSRQELARSALWPHLSGHVSERRATVNLEAMGIHFPGLLPMPSPVGPFSTFDVRGSLQQRILDLGSLGRYRAAGKGVDAAALELEQVRDGVAAAVAAAYLETCRAQAAVESAEASVALAQELADLARSLKESGTGTRVEVTRAQVQLADRRQQQLQARNALENARLRLLRAIGLDLHTLFQVEGLGTSDEAPLPNPEQAVARALDARADYRAQQGWEESARVNYRAARADRYPSLSGFADYGSIGPTPGEAIPTWTVGLAVEIPLFDGGGVDARRHEAAARYREEQLKTEELRRQVELDVVTASNDLAVAREQTGVAREGLDLARQELEQARRRYASGVTTSLEVTDAQTRLKRAEENEIAARFHYRLARIGLAAAMGVLRSGGGL